MRRNLTTEEVAAAETFRQFGPLTITILRDCYHAGLTPQEAVERARAITTYLSMAHANLTQRMSALVTWNTHNQGPRYTFSRQALQMCWDYAEINPCHDHLGFLACVEQICAVLERLPAAAVDPCAAAEPDDRP